MIKRAFSLGLAALLLAPLTAPAQTPGGSLARCLADNTTGKDRKDLARWVFLSMAAHPEISQYSAAEIGKAANETDATIANLLTHLLAESCLNETRAAIREGGPTAIQAAFQTLGQLAMQELMSAPQVTARMADFQKHIDHNKLNRVFGAK